MIARNTGEILFADGLALAPQNALPAEHLPDPGRERPLAVPGWTRHLFGVHGSEHGAFVVEAVSDPFRRIQLVMLAHEHSFYEPETLDDAERRAFHEGVIAADLAGQREFGWGDVFCRLNPPENKNWLIVRYAFGPQVPGQEPDVLAQLYAEATPEDG